MTGIETTEQQTSERSRVHRLFLRWWNSQGLTSEPERSKLVARVAYEAGMIEARRVGTPTADVREQAKAIVSRFNIDSCDWTDHPTTELINAIASALLFAPSDEVAQRRAIDNLLGFLKVTPLKLNEDGAATLSMLIDAVTTDVEQGTCTEHEK